MNKQQELQIILHRASEHHSRGELSEALRLFEQADSIHPNWPQLLNAIGTVLMDMKEYDRAEARFCKAVQAAPPYPPALYNLARLYHSTGRKAQAAEHYRKTVDADPSMAMAWNNLGLILQEDREPEEALLCFRKASELLPDAAEIWNNIGIALEDLEEFGQAREAFEQAVKKDPGHISALYNLAALELRLEHHDIACTLLEKVLELDPENESARYLLQVTGRLPAPEAAPVGYIQKVFDDCADKFEKTLVDKLSYRTPEALFNLVKPSLAPGMDILDLGCGTGLGAEFYRPYARLLAGMDASGKMLEIAKNKGVYDRLFLADILAPWDMDGLSFDLIYSSDVFVYFGRLDTVLAHIKKHLHPGGMVAFSVEHAEQDNEDWILGQSGRYAHTERYIDGQLEKSGFHILEKAFTVLRKEGKHDVRGMLITARKR